MGRFLGPSARFVPSLAARLFIKRMYHEPTRMLPGTVEGYSSPLRNPQTLQYLLQATKSWYRDFDALKTSFPAVSDIPTLLLWGKYDSVVSLKTGEAMLQHLHNAEFVIMEAGHLPYEELPREFNRIVNDFLLESKVVG